MPPVPLPAAAPVAVIDEFGFQEQRAGGTHSDGHEVSGISSSDGVHRFFDAEQDSGFRPPPPKGPPPSHFSHDTSGDVANGFGSSSSTSVSNVDNFANSFTVADWAGAASSAEAGGGAVVDWAPAAAAGNDWGSDHLHQPPSDLSLPDAGWASSQSHALPVSDLFFSDDVAPSSTSLPSRAASALSSTATVSHAHDTPIGGFAFAAAASDFAGFSADSDDTIRTDVFVAVPSFSSGGIAAAPPPLAPQFGSSSAFVDGSEGRCDAMTQRVASPQQLQEPPVLPVWDSAFYEDAAFGNTSVSSADGDVSRSAPVKGQENEVGTEFI